MFDKEGELEGWMARNSAIAMATMVATIHHTLIPSSRISLPPFHTIIEVRWRIYYVNGRAILIPDQIGSVL
jgi:hypothetical protein